MNTRQQQTVRTLLEALPYIRRFSGAAIVIGCEGATLASERLRRWLAEDIALLRLVGMKPAVVHGAAADADGEALAALVRWHGAMVIDVVDPETAAFDMLIEEAVLLVPVADGPAAMASLAGELAAQIKAEKLIFLADVDGIYDNDVTEPKVISECDLDVLGRLQAAGAIDGELLPKVQAMRWALEAGVTSAHLIDGRVDHALLLEVLTDAGCGTKVTRVMRQGKGVT